jgi:hypothetical protein
MSTPIQSIGTVRRQRVGPFLFVGERNVGRAYLDALSGVPVGDVQEPVGSAEDVGGCAVDFDERAALDAVREPAAAPRE